MKILFGIQDHFGITPELYFQGQRKYHSTFGIILSVLINAAAIGVLITLLMELFFKNNPIVNKIKINNNKGLNITLGSDLIIAIGILNKDYGIFNDPSVYQLQFYYEVKVNHNGRIINRATPLKLINCTQINYLKYKEAGLAQTFFSNQLDQYYCFNKTEIDKEIIIGGLFGSDFYATIRIDVNKCSNSTERTCASANEINNKLKDCWFEMFFIDHYVSIYNYSHPIQVYSNSLFTRIDPFFLKTLNAYFFTIDVLSNNNIIFDSIANYSSVQFEKVNNDIVSIAEYDKKNIISLSIISSLLQEINYRSYIKIPSIAGNVGGILNGLCIIGHLIVFSIERVKYKRILYNSVFDFSLENKKEKVIPLYEENIVKTAIKNDNKCVIISKDNPSYGTMNPIVIPIPTVNCLKLDISLVNSLKMLCPCWNKDVRKKMIREYNKFEINFGKLVDYVSVIKRINSISIMQEHLDIIQGTTLSQDRNDKIKWIVQYDTKRPSTNKMNLIVCKREIPNIKQKIIQSEIRCPLKIPKPGFGSENKASFTDGKQHNWSVRNINSSAMLII